MADLHKKQLEDQLGDAMLSYLMDEYAEAAGSQLLSGFEESGQVIPDILNHSCLDMIRAHNRASEKSALLRRTVFRAAKTAAVLVIIFSLSANFIMSVEALRVPVLNFCIKMQDQFTNLIFGGDGNTMPQSSDPDPAFMMDLPAGYQFQQQSHNHEDTSAIYPDSFLILLYTNEAGDNLTILTQPAAGTSNFDTQDSDCTEIQLVGMDAVYIKKADGSLRTIWIDESRQRLYDISAENMEEAEFLLFAEKTAANFKSGNYYSE